MEKFKDTILALGLGNILLSDEAVGVRVIEALARSPQTAALGLRPLDGGTMGLSLLVELEDAGAMIVIDAAALGEAPGAVKVFVGQAMDHFLRRRGRSPHDIGLDDLLDGLRLRSALPERRALVGIEPRSLTVGDELTPEVAAAVPGAVSAVIDVAQHWRDTDTV